ncbi:hypothetical protein [Fodinibius sp. SL11]|uniref:hypothetical protein n=1 Tax=Fodinibius sp. SL11 TaxID=3425690 RepID=UPI003F881E8C
MTLLTSTDLKKAAIFFVFCFSLIFATQSIAQVSIAPTSLFFDNQNRFGSLTISNGGQQAQEISISTEFGYPTTKDGSLTIVNDSTLAETKSIADWVKVFPQNFTLQPNQRQTVRFVARPPNSLEPGGYWSRVKIRSNPVSPPIESVEEGQVGAQINLVVNQVIAAHFRTQNAETGVKVSSVDFNQENNTGQIAVSMEQTGNAPFVGSISLEVSNSNGETVWDTNTTNSVYTTITRTFNIDLSELDPGQYTISGEITSQRRDINQDKLLQIQPVSFEKQITIE